MLKSLTYVLTILAVLFLTGLDGAYAYPNIEVEGFVMPGSGTADGDTTTFDAVTYTFNVTNADPKDGVESYMDFISLEFEPDVFADPGSVVPLSPDNWAYDQRESGSGSTYVLGRAGLGLDGLIAEGEQLTFVVEDLSVYNSALASPDPWNEGQIWAQSFTARDTFNGGDGGSTVLVPEPVSSTLFILGGATFGFRRFRKNRN